MELQSGMTNALVSIHLYFTWSTALIGCLSVLLQTYSEGDDGTYNTDIPWQHVEKVGKFYRWCFKQIHALWWPYDIMHGFSSVSSRAARLTVENRSCDIFTFPYLRDFFFYFFNLI